MATRSNLGTPRETPDGWPPPALGSLISPASKCAKPERTAARQRLPQAPSRQMTLTWGLAALPEASGARDSGVSIREDARSAARRPRAPGDPERAARRAGRTGGSRATPARVRLAPAPPPISAHSAGPLPRPRAHRSPRPAPAMKSSLGLGRTAHAPGRQPTGARVPR